MDVWCVEEKVRKFDAGKIVGKKSNKLGIPVKEFDSIEKDVDTNGENKREAEIEGDEGEDGGGQKKRSSTVAMSSEDAAASKKKVNCFCKVKYLTMTRKIYRHRRL